MKDHCFQLSDEKSSSEIESDLPRVREYIVQSGSRAWVRLV